MAQSCGVLLLAALCTLATVHPSLAADADAPYKVIFHLENLERGGIGEVIVQVHPEWAPLGAKRFAELLEQRFFDGNRFFRVVCGFVAQFGISGDPKVSAAWKGQTILDDPQQFHVANNRGRLSFYTDGPNDRETQVIFNVKDNDYLDEKGYVPFAEVTDGMFFIDRIYNKYGGAARAPDPETLQAEGNAYADREFPLLTHIKTVEIIKEPTSLSLVSDPSTTYSPLLITVGVFVVISVIGGGWFFRAGSSAVSM